MGSFRAGGERLTVDGQRTHLDTSAVRILADPEGDQGRPELLRLRQQQEQRGYGEQNDQFDSSQTKHISTTYFNSPCHNE